mmetsp:Transcript_474/g.1450  ORF Transcript_474/g.1450 Transcript_474/m.1450 type:complete len:80 (-) Transcript_474:119-358(-)
MASHIVSASRIAASFARLPTSLNALYATTSAAGNAHARITSPMVILLVTYRVIDSIAAFAYRPIVVNHTPLQPKQLRRH